MRDKKMLLGVITVFILGIVIGGLAATVLIRGRVMRLMRDGPPRVHRVVGDVMTRGIDLTEEQRRELRRITDEYEPRIDEFVRRSREETRKLFEEMEGRIEQILTPEQRIKFRENVKRHKERFGRPPPGMEEGFGRPPGMKGGLRKPPGI